MPKPYPKEFRDDVVRVAGKRDAGVTLEQIAADFGIHAMTLSKWLRQAAIDDGDKPGVSTIEAAELRAAKRADQVARAGERGPASGGRVFVAGEPVPKMIFPVVRDLAADEIPVTVTCRVLKLCYQQYYRWLNQPITDAELDKAYVANVVFDAHRDDPEFGYQFLADEVRAAGFDVGDRIVWRICRDNGWWCSFAKKKRRKASAPGTAAHDDLVRRHFTADGPNQVWVADLTEHRSTEGKAHLCAIKDLWSNQIVGWAIDERMKARLVVAAIEMAVARRGDVAGCILHSDRGSQFRARKVQRTLTRHLMVGSMGQIGTAADNATMESFFSLLQKNVLNTRRWDTRDQLRIAIVTWIERTYHQRRRQPALDRLTPTEYETIMTPTAAQAA